MTADRIGEAAPAIRSNDFRDWRARLDRARVPPVIAFAGSRGKTSVLRAVESMLHAGGYRFASWTDRGVEIEGERQRGELGPWSRVLTRVTAGALDLALQELDWVTLQAVASRDTSFPVVAISTLCANNEACLVSPETLLARKALQKIRSRLAPGGRLVLNADDLSVLGSTKTDVPSHFLAGIRREAPAMAKHLAGGGDGCWIEDAAIVVREHGEDVRVAQLQELPSTYGGVVPFAVQNALLATAIARACAIPYPQIARGLAAHDPKPELMPGSFNVFAYGSSVVVVDRPMPSWFLRASLRAAATLGPGRLVRVVGPMYEIGNEDLVEVGRLLGRNGGVLIVHGNWLPERLEALRRGAAANQVPPIYLRSESERAAILQGLALLRGGDIMLVLAEDALADVRLIGRQASHGAAKVDAAGAA